MSVFWIDAYGDGLFVPLRDATNGDTTYGGGRYLLDTVKSADLGGSDGQLEIDLNFAYHPSCVHDASWSCPLAPADDRVGVRIEGGERLAAVPAVDVRRRARHVTAPTHVEVLATADPERFTVLLGDGRVHSATLAHRTRRGLGLHGVPAGAGGARAGRAHRRARPLARERRRGGAGGGGGRAARWVRRGASGPARLRIVSVR